MSELTATADAEADTYILVAGQNAYEVSAVGLGNPHVVLLVENVDTAPVATLGPPRSSQVRLPASFFEALPLPWVVLFRVRVRLRSMFRGLRRFNFASLKPSMPESLGGRRGSRSDMN